MLLAVVVGGAAGISVQDSEKQTENKSRQKKEVLFQIPKSPVPAHTTFSLLSSSKEPCESLRNQYTRTRPPGNWAPQEGVGKGF